jgi:hypothetical protein
VALAHLRPGGILQQWLPEGDTTVTSAFAQSLRQSFADVRVFQSIEGWGYHFLASASPMKRLSAATLAARLPAAAARDVGQFENLLDRERPIEDLIQPNPSAPLLTDDRPVNEYYLLRRMAGH